MSQPDMLGTPVAYFGGRAGSTGASYEIEVYLDAGTYRVMAFSAANGQARKPQGVLYEGNDVVAAMTALLKKANSKRAPGERSYTRPFEGTPRALEEIVEPLPKKPGADGSLPAHPQIWQQGQPLDTLPPHVRGGGIAAKANLADIRPSAVTAGVMLPRRGPMVSTAQGVDFVASLARYVDTQSWLTRKVEGERLHIQHGPDGLVGGGKYGQPIMIPPAVADVLSALPQGVWVDGELAAVADDGREALYAGAAATRQIYTVFDLRLGMTTTSASPYYERRAELDQLVAALGDQSVVVVVATARTRDEKAAMVQTCLDRGWEGIVVYDQNAPYQAGKVKSVLKFKPFITLDAVVIGYRDSGGERAGGVGAVELGLYNEAGELVPIGAVGSGFTTQTLARLAGHRDAGEAGYVVSVRSYPPTFNLILNKASFLRFRGPSDPDHKPATDCTFENEEFALVTMV